MSGAGAIAGAAPPLLQLAWRRQAVIKTISSTRVLASAQSSVRFGEPNDLPRGPTTYPTTYNRRQRLKNGLLLSLRRTPLSPPYCIALMSFSMPPLVASSALRQAGIAFKNARIQTAKVGAERNAATTTPRPSATRPRASAAARARATTWREDLGYTCASRRASFSIALSWPLAAARSNQYLALPRSTSVPSPAL